MARPKIRTAKFADIPGIVSILLDAHRRSEFANLCEVNTAHLRSMLAAALNRMNADAKTDRKAAGSVFLAVAEDNGKVDALIWGELMPLYLIGDKLEATDLFWLALEEADPYTAPRLLRAFHRWVPEGAFIRQGATDAIGDSGRTAKMYERAGMKQGGVIYQKWKETPK